MSEYMKLVKYLNLDHETGKVTTKSAVEQYRDPILSFNDVWVVVSDFFFKNSINFCLYLKRIC